jgi:hypothetical protein
MKRLLVIAAVWTVLILGAAEVRAGVTSIWAMTGSGNGDFCQIDPVANTTAFIGRMRDPRDGSIGDGWSTVGETPDQTLFFMRRYQSDIHIFSVPANNIQVTAGVVTNLTDRGSTTLGGNADGLVNGPDGKLYMTAYQNTAGGPVNGLFRYDPNTGTTDFVGAFRNNAGPSGRNSFYTDLAFDPLTGDLIGTGTDANVNFIPYRLHASQILGQTNQTWD